MFNFIKISENVYVPTVVNGNVYIPTIFPQPPENSKPILILGVNPVTTYESVDNSKEGVKSGRPLGIVKRSETSKRKSIIANTVSKPLSKKSETVLKHKVEKDSNISQVDLASCKPATSLDVNKSSSTDASKGENISLFANMCNNSHAVCVKTNIEENSNSPQLNPLKLPISLQRTTSMKQPTLPPKQQTPSKQPTSSWTRQTSFKQPATPKEAATSKEPASPKQPTTQSPRQPASLQQVEFPKLASLSTQPAPLSSQPTPLSSQPAPLSTQPAPLSTQPAPLSTQPAPLLTQPADLSTQPAPLSTQPAPLSTQPALLSTQPTSQSNKLVISKRTIFLSKQAFWKQSTSPSTQPALSLKPDFSKQPASPKQPASQQQLQFPKLASLSIQPAPLSTQSAPLSTQSAPLSTQSAPLSTQPASLSTQPASLSTTPDPLLTQPAPQSTKPDISKQIIFLSKRAIWKQPTSPSIQPALSSKPDFSKQPATQKQPASPRQPASPQQLEFPKPATLSTQPATLSTQTASLSTCPASLSTISAPLSTQPAPQSTKPDISKQIIFLSKQALWKQPTSPSIQPALSPKPDFSKQPTIKKPTSPRQPASLQQLEFPKLASLSTQLASLSTQPTSLSTQPAPASTQPAPASIQPAPASTQPALSLKPDFSKKPASSSPKDQSVSSKHSAFPNSGVNFSKNPPQIKKSTKNRVKKNQVKNSTSSLVGQKFASFVEVKSLVSSLEKEHCSKLFVSCCRTIKYARKWGLLSVINEDLEYYDIRYRCSYGSGEVWKSNLNGKIPNQSTSKQACPYMIRFKSKEGWIEIVKAVEQHNHSEEKESADGKSQMKRMHENDSDSSQQMKKHRALPDTDKRKDLPHPPAKSDLLKRVAADCPEDSTAGSNDSALIELEAVQPETREGMTEIGQQIQNVGYTTDSTATTSNMISAELEPEQSMTSKKGITEIGQLEKHEVHPKLKNMCYPLILSILNKETIVEIFTDFNIVPSMTPPPRCGTCGSPTKVIKRGASFLGFVWYCTRKNFKNNPCHKRINPIQNTILEKTLIEIEDLMFIMIGFAWNETISFVHTHLDHFKISRGLPRTTPRVYLQFQKFEEVVQIFASYGVTIIKVNPKLQLDVQLHIFLQSVAAVYPGPGKTGLRRLTVNKHVLKTELSKDVQDIMEKCSENTLKTSGNSREKSKHQSPQKKIKKRKILKLNKREESWTSEDSDSEGKKLKSEKT